MPHLYYLLRIGGDHFEYRPLDFYWPLLALPAAEGIAHLGARLAAGSPAGTLAVLAAGAAGVGGGALHPGAVLCQRAAGRAPARIHRVAAGGAGDASDSWPSPTTYASSLFDSMLAHASVEVTCVGIANSFNRRLVDAIREDGA